MGEGTTGGAREGLEGPQKIGRMVRINTPPAEKKEATLDRETTKPKGSDYVPGDIELIEFKYLKPISGDQNSVINRGGNVMYVTKNDEGTKKQVNTMISSNNYNIEIGSGSTVIDLKGPGGISVKGLTVIAGKDATPTVANLNPANTSFTIRGTGSVNIEVGGGTVPIISSTQNRAVGAIPFTAGEMALAPSITHTPGSKTLDIQSNMVVSKDPKAKSLVLEMFQGNKAVRIATVAPGATANLVDSQGKVMFTLDNTPDGGLEASQKSLKDFQDKQAKALKERLPQLPNFKGFTIEVTNREVGRRGAFLTNPERERFGSLAANMPLPSGMTLSGDSPVGTMLSAVTAGTNENTVIPGGTGAAGLKMPAV